MAESTDYRKMELPKAFNIVRSATGLVACKGLNGRSMGTGFVVTQEGGFVTCAHVILDDAKNPYDQNLIKFENLPALPFEIREIEEDYDLAFCGITGKARPKPVILCGMPLPPIGYEVASLGVPFGKLESKNKGREDSLRPAEENDEDEYPIEAYFTLAKGIMSAEIPSNFSPQVRVFQIDNMHPVGSSGGPVFVFDEGIPSIIGVIYKFKYTPLWNDKTNGFVDPYCSVAGYTWAIHIGYVVEKAFELKLGIVSIKMS